MPWDWIHKGYSDVRKYVQSQIYMKKDEVENWIEVKQRRKREPG